MASYEATLTDLDYMHIVWLGQYKTPERAQIAIERALEVMRSSSTIVCLDDNKTPITISVNLCVDYTVAALVKPIKPLGRLRPDAKSATD